MAISLHTTIKGLILVMASSVSSAGVITNWENTMVDFTSSWLGNTLRIEIDAANRTAGWADASHIDSIAINGPDAWSWTATSDIQLTGPGTFGGDIDGTGLNAKGCQGTSLGKNHQCWSGLAALTDNMIFDFIFKDGIVSDYTDTPHLKVRFVDEQGEKVGSLLSTDFVGTSVPEPGSIALLGLGLLGLGVARRTQKS